MGEKKMEIKRQSDNNCSLIREGEDSIGTDGDPRVHRGETERVKSSLFRQFIFQIITFYLCICYVYIKEKSLNSRGGI